MAAPPLVVSVSWGFQGGLSPFGCTAELQAALEGLEDRAASREEIKQFEATLAGLYARKGDVDADVRGVRDALATAVEQGAKRGDLEALRAQLQLFMYSPEMQQAQRVGTQEIARMQERLEAMARQQDEMARKQEEAHGLTPRLVEDQTRDQVAALRGEYLIHFEGRFIAVLQQHCRFWSAHI